MVTYEHAVLRLESAIWSDTANGIVRRNHISMIMNTTSSRVKLWLVQTDINVLNLLMLWRLISLEAYSACIKQAKVLR